MKIRLRGDTDFIPLPDLLQWLESHRKSGILTITDGDADQSFFFEEGAIIFVSSTREGQRFGEFLAESGHIDAASIETSLLEARKYELCFTQYLLDVKRIAMEILTDALTRLAETIFAEVLERPDCSFSFSAPLPPMISQGPVHIATGHLILDSILKMDEKRSRRKS